MIGMSATTGAALSGSGHLAQSIDDILSTPIGSRVMRRDYGSALFELLGAPMNGVGKLRLFAAIAVALARWEPRLRLTRIAVAAPTVDGRFAIQLDGTRTDDAAPTALATLTIPLRPATA